MQLGRFFLGIAAALGGLLAVVMVGTLLVTGFAAGVRSVTVPPGAQPAAYVPPETPPAAPSRGWIETIVDWAHRTAGEAQPAPAGGGPDTFMQPSPEQNSRSWTREFFAARTEASAFEAWLRRCQAVWESSVTLARTTDTRDFLSWPSSHDSVVSLNNALSLGRAENAALVANARWNLEFTTWVVVLLGLATTVLVSLNATTFADDKSLAGRSIKWLAIVFPAIGTAAAALTAFYAPREELARASLALASLRQVHSIVAAEVHTLPCLTVQAEEMAGRTIEARVTDWRRRLREAQAVAEAAALAAIQPAGSGTGQGGGNTGGGGTIPPQRQPGLQTPGTGGNATEGGAAMIPASGAPTDN